MPKGVDASTGRGTRFKDRVGTRHGRLTFTRHVGEDHHRHQVWEARCDCGTIIETAVTAKTRSCGCLRREVAAETQRRKALPPEVRAANLANSRVMSRAKRKSDPLARMQARLSRLHRHALRQVGAIKTSPTFEQLGYTAEQFVVHIERQFGPGMGWHNMDRWQLDHVIPVSEATNEADVVALNQLPNLRPMWSAENNRKRNKRETLL